MNIGQIESQHKCCDVILGKQSNTDRATHLIAERFALSHDHAREVCRLAGLGQQEARR